MIPIMLAIGILVGVLSAVMLEDFILLPGVILLFGMAGLTWRSDMPPLIPFALTYQWLFAFGGFIFFQLRGYYPGGGETGSLHAMLWISMLGFLGLTLGIRVGMRVFRNQLHYALNVRLVNYDLGKLVLMTAILFGFNYVFEFSPMKVWFGGAQIINNLLALRFVPYFLLMIASFQSKKGYGYAASGSIIVILPQVLTGFSDFKEILFVIMLAGLMQWRPWLRTLQQGRQNRMILLSASIGAVLMLGLGMLWQGGVKDQWRSYVWDSELSSSPTERMQEFGRIVVKVAGTLDADTAYENLLARLSSGSLYFSYVIGRVPQSMPFEGGTLLTKALTNAVIPRFLYPDKANLGGDSWLVQTYAGIAAAGNEEGASIGLGYMAEFYIDYGISGVFALCIFYGFALITAAMAFAIASPSREVFIALVLGLLMRYFLAFDGSFIKLFAGMIQYTIIVGGATAVLGRPTVRWITTRRRKPMPIHGSA